MTDNEKLELLSIFMKIHDIEERIKKLLDGIPNYTGEQKEKPFVPPDPQRNVPNPHPGLQKTKDGPRDIYSSAGNVPNISAEEIRRHTMEQNPFSKDGGK